MILRVEHIGVAVENLPDAEKLISLLLSKPSYKKEEVPSESVTTSFFRAGETKIELLESTKADGPIGKFLQKKGEGIHHIAFEVDDLYADMKRLKDAGFQLINATPTEGADNKLVCFIHPKSCNGILVELCQEKRT